MNLLFDGHLDLAMNALHLERDQTTAVAELRRPQDATSRELFGQAMVSLPEMRSSGTFLCVSTLLARVRPELPFDTARPRRSLDHPTAAMAHAAACGQLAYYEHLANSGHVRLVRTAADLEAHTANWNGGSPTAPVGVILTIEGADPIVEPEELAWWHERGVRSLLLAHSLQGRYAYGTPENHYGNEGPVEQGPLTDRGRRLLGEMDRLGMPLDLTHLCDESFWETVERFSGPVYASHSNCRALAPGMRQLSDEQVRRIVERRGVIGIAMHTPMLRPGTRETLERDGCGLEDAADHIDHVCQLAGSAGHVAIGSDLDGGFGTEWAPRELDTIGDLHKLCPILQRRGYEAADVERIMHGNWSDFFGRVLPR